MRFINIIFKKISNPINLFNPFVYFFGLFIFFHFSQFCTEINTHMHSQYHQKQYFYKLWFVFLFNRRIYKLHYIS